jgi:transcriptional regulator with XRE-family HTH domain
MSALFGLGKALRWLRAKQDRRQYELAAAAGITKAMLSSYETGKQKPSLDTLEKILDTLGADLADLNDALQIVNERGGAAGTGQRDGSPAWETHRRERRAGALDSSPSAGVDVYGVLGLDHALPAAEEAAFSEMLRGFHRLLRYMHRGLVEATAGTGGPAGEPPAQSPVGGGEGS